jgi:NADPH-dependent 2,4-dienoyl-CoA reductase/sulfur reductase-like enzyme
MALMNQKILVVGGGIAGCSAGIALAAAGHNVRIVEAQAEWRFQSSGTIRHAKPPSATADLLAGASRVRNTSNQWAGTTAYRNAANDYRSSAFA